MWVMGGAARSRSCAVSASQLRRAAPAARHAAALPSATSRQAFSQFAHRSATVQAGGAVPALQAAERQLQRGAFARPQRRACSAQRATPFAGALSAARQQRRRSDAAAAVAPCSARTLTFCPPAAACRCAPAVRRQHSAAPGKVLRPLSSVRHAVSARHVAQPARRRPASSPSFHDVRRKRTLPGILRLTSPQINGAACNVCRQSRRQVAARVCSRRRHAA